MTFPFTRLLLPLLLGISVGFAAMARAETVLTVESAVGLALERNPELVAARKTIAEAEARLAGAGKLANPEFEAEGALGKDDANRVEIGLMQPLPVTARLRLEKEVSRLEVEKARAEVALREWELAGAVRLAVIRHVAAGAALELTRAQAETAGKMADFTAARVQEGQASSLEAGTAALEQRRLQGSLLGLELERAQAAAELGLLLGTPSTDFRTTGTLELPATLPPESGALPPTVAVAAASVEAGRREIALAEAQRWEDIGVGVFVENERGRDDADALENETTAGLRVSLPLPLWNSGRAAVQEKVAAAERLEAELAAAQAKAVNGTRAAYQELALRHTLARELNGELLDLARRQLAEYEAAQGRGEIGFDEVYRARERLISLETAALEARKEYHLAHARWRAGLALP